MSILNLTDAPLDPIRKIAWLSGVLEQAKTELDDALAPAYFQARMEGPKRFEAAVRAGPYAMKTALALTRRENRKRGQMVRWGDGLDPTSRS